MIGIEATSPRQCTARRQLNVTKDSGFGAARAYGALLRWLRTDEDMQKLIRCCGEHSWPQKYTCSTSTLPENGSTEVA